MHNEFEMDQVHDTFSILELNAKQINAFHNFFVNDNFIVNEMS